MRAGACASTTMLSFCDPEVICFVRKALQLHLHSSGYIPSKTSCDRAATFSSATATQLHSVDARHLPLALRPLAKVLKQRWCYEGVEPAHVSESTKIQNASESSKEDVLAWFLLAMPSADS